MKLKKKIQLKMSNIFIIILLLVGFLTGFFLVSFGKSITPRLLDIVTIKLDKLTNHFLLEFFNRDILSEEFIGDIIYFTQNSKEEIIAVDFNLEKAYTALSDATQRMKNGLNSAEMGEINNLAFIDLDFENSPDGLILYIPMGRASDLIYFTNLGPKIPVKIKFVNSLYTNLKTKVKDYGINNSLLEVYIEIMVEEEIITPVHKDRMKKNYEVLIASKIIQGKVPEYYGGILESRSSLFSMPSEDKS